ncbi:MAG: FprA family A-type flavoprotein [bacterium]|nr:FprA family A-type flavoprotein [bacterium]
MFITDDIKYIGVNDHEIDLFEGQYIVPNGMAYNSYIIIDGKTAVMDSVDRRFAAEWIGNIKSVLGERKPDYLIVQHMEPDHSAGISMFMSEFPEASIVSSLQAFQMMNNFFGTSFENRRIIVSGGSSLSLGKHGLSFVGAPMVHWPEVIVTYDAFSKTLFSADGFGKFGALDAEEEWDCEARRYYIGIVGKYGPQVQSLLKKASALDISRICPLHGPVLSENLGHYIELYDTWSSYRPESKGAVIAYTSVYGHTKEAAELLGARLEEAGVKVSMHDLARTDMAEAVEDAFRYDTVVFATTTYNMGIFPFMSSFINHLTERGFKNRRIAMIENGSWAPVAIKIMKQMLEGCKGLSFAENNVTLKSALNEDSRNMIGLLAEELSK